MNSLSLLLSRVDTELGRGRTMLFDVWSGTNKVLDKEELDSELLASEIKEMLADGAVVRVRMYWQYGTQRPRFQEEFIIDKSASTMSGIDKPVSQVDDEDYSPPARQKATNGQANRMNMMNDSNPLTWMLNEKVEQLREFKEKYAKSEEKIEALRQKNEELERTIIKKDHEIDNLSGEVEQGAGLGGFMSSNPAVADKIIETLGAIVGKALPASAESTTDANTVAGMVAEWISQQDEASQEYVKSIMQFIATQHRANPEFLETFYQTIIDQQQTANASTGTN